MPSIFFETTGRPNRRQAKGSPDPDESGRSATLFTTAQAKEPRLTFDNAHLFASHRIAVGREWLVQTPQARKSRLDAQTLSHALTIAWDLLVAADDPATAGERAAATRRQMARHLVDVALSSHDMTDLWLAALNAVVDGNAFRRAG
jgi:hypothetical protein